MGRKWQTLHPSAKKTMVKFATWETGARLRSTNFIVRQERPKSYNGELVLMSAASDAHGYGRAKSSSACETTKRESVAAARFPTMSVSLKASTQSQVIRRQSRDWRLG
jgi:hypothetical protein